MGTPASDIYDLFKGTRAPEFPAIRQMAEDLILTAMDHVKPFYRQIAIEGQKAGLDMGGVQYLFWILFEDSTHWPQLPVRSRRAINAFLSLAKKMGNYPNYNNALKVPPIDQEQDVDQAMIALADWCINVEGQALKREWTRIVIKGSRKAGLTPAEMDAAFRKSLVSQPYNMPMSILLTYLVFSVIG